MNHSRFSCALAASALAASLAGAASAQCSAGPTTFCVTSDAPKPANFPNPGGCTCFYSINGTPGLELTLTRGVAYTFRMVNVPGFHIFEIGTSVVGADFGSSALLASQGVSTQGITGNDSLTFTPNATTPDLVFLRLRDPRKHGLEDQRR